MTIEEETKLKAFMRFCSNCGNDNINVIPKKLLCRTDEGYYIYYAVCPICHRPFSITGNGHRVTIGGKEYELPTNSVIFASEKLK